MNVTLVRALRVWLLSFVLLSCCGAELALAQARRVLLLPVSGDDALAEDRAAAERALAAALERQHAIVLSSRDLPPPEETPRCATPECATEALRMLQADLAVTSAVWSKAQAGGERSTFSVMLVDRAGERYPGAAPINTSVADAAQAALLAAQSLLLLGPGPWLEVTGGPEGATLYIDGELIGALPYRAAITAGAHDLQIEAAGAPRWQKWIDVPLSAQRVVTVTVDDLSSSAGAFEPYDTDAAPAPSRASPWNYALGPALGVAGALLLIAPIRTLANDGECRGELDDRGRCSDRVDVGTLSYLQFAAGGLALAAGAFVLITEPLRVELATDSRSAQARVRLDL